MTKRDKTTRLLGSLKEKRVPIGTEIFLPNHSGDHVRSIKRAVPVNDADLVNKKYVDDKKVESFPTSFTTGSIPFSNGSNLAEDNDELFWNDTNKRLGIGTVTPNQQLEVVGQAQITHTDGSGDHLTIQPFSDGNTYFNAFGASTGEGGFYFRTNDGSDFAFRILNNSGTDLLTLTNGKVGIGITTPATKLEVAGGALVNYAAQFTTDQNFGVNIISSSHSGSRWLLRTQYDTNTDAFVVRADGNVGVGTAAPDAKLQVVGNTKLGDDNTPPNHMEISATGDVTFRGTSGLAFAEIYAADVATEITIAGTGKANKVQITAFAVDGVSNNTTPDHTNDHITIVKAGMYMCNVSMHVKTPAGGSSHVVGYSVWKNNGAVGGEFANLHGQRQLASGGTDEGSISLSGIIDLAVNDTIEVWVWDLTGTDNIVIDDINLSLVQIGGT